MSEAFSFAKQARTERAIAVVAGVWIILVAALIWLEAAPLIVAFIGAFTLPAIYDLIRNPTSGLHMDDYTLSWFSGRRRGEVALIEVDHVRLDTRLDFSVRVTVVLDTGRKVRLPFESTPPHQAFEDALTARGLKTQRHHFQLMQ